MPNKPLTRKQFQHRLLTIMDRKDHWAWPVFAGGSLSKAQLHRHFQQEFAVYVRDFPVFLSRIHGHNPPLAVRSVLAENIFEEDTGGLSLGISHPNLFLKMMKGLGFSSRSFEDIPLLPASRRYRAWLDRISRQSDWVLGVAVMTIFVEGSIHDRRELTSSSQLRTPREIEKHIKDHPLVRHHGLSPSHMDLSRAHQLVENGHRHDAYNMVLTYAKDAKQQKGILSTLQQTLNLWLQYRDGIAQSCGIPRLERRAN